MHYFNNAFHSNFFITITSYFLAFILRSAWKPLENFIPTLTPPRTMVHLIKIYAKPFHWLIPFLQA